MSVLSSPQARDKPCKTELAQQFTDADSVHHSFIRSTSELDADCEDDDTIVSITSVPSDLDTKIETSAVNIPELQTQSPTNETKIERETNEKPPVHLSDSLSLQSVAERKKAPTTLPPATGKQNAAGSSPSDRHHTLRRSTRTRKRTQPFWQLPQRIIEQVKTTGTKAARRSNVVSAPKIKLTTCSLQSLLVPPPFSLSDSHSATKVQSSTPFRTCSLQNLA